MDQKQIFLTFERGFIESVKKQCAMEEKRSVTSLLRKIFADLPLDKELLDELSERLNTEQNGSKTVLDPVNVAVRFPGDEYWEARAKASLARMTVKEFSIHLLELWANGEFDEWINQIKQKQKSEKRYVGQ